MVQPVTQVSERVCVAIGGMGGSGTRLVAQIAMDLGFYLGSDFNRACDNLWFTLLFKHQDIVSVSDTEFDRRLTLFRARMINQHSELDVSAIVDPLTEEARFRHSTSWLKLRAASFKQRDPEPGAHSPWGWKEPNTHIVLDRLMPRLPRLKYVHVVRNGLDMAYSRNQNQLRNWSEFILGERLAVTPESSLRFWCAMHERVLKIAEAHDRSRFHWLNYDKLCRTPEGELRRLLQFLGVERPSDAQIQRLAQRILPPSSLGQFRLRDSGRFSSSDIRFVDSMGFETS